MSFSLTVKEELILNKRTKVETELVLLGMISTGALDGLFSSSNKKVVVYLQGIIKQIYSFDLAISKQNNLYLLDVNNCKTNLEAIKNSILTNKSSCGAFLAGAFLARGSINDPDKGTYHFEISCNQAANAIYIQRVINALNYPGMDFNAKLVKRRTKLVVYIKEMNKILDLLRLMEANKVAFKYEEISIIRQIKNEEKRKVNWEIANDHKQMLASENQLAVINYLYVNYPLEKLEPSLLLIMKVRQENPMLSIRQLTDYLKKNYDLSVSRAWISRRFTKLSEIAKEFKRSYITNK